MLTVLFRRVLCAVATIGSDPWPRIGSIPISAYANRYLSLQVSLTACREALLLPVASYSQTKKHFLEAAS